MAILNHGSTIRTADGGQSTTTIVTASNIGSYAVASNATYYIGTTQNVFNRASGAQTLTGVSIDGNAATVTNGVYTTGTQTIGGDKTFSNALTLSNGGTSARMLSGYTSLSSNDDWQNSPFSVRERDLIGLGSSANTYSPNLNFHWGSRVSNSLWMNSSGQLNWGSYDASGVPAVDGAFGAGNIYGNVFYDLGNTSYYLDPANTGTSLVVAGNVGIGTTSPGYKLDITGDARIASAAGAGALYFGTLDTSNIYLKLDNNYDLSLVQNAASGNGLYLAGAGNVYVSIDSNNNATTDAFIVQNNAIKAGTELFRVQENGVVTASTDFRAPIFYDSDNTSYYINAAGASSLNTLTMAGIITTVSSGTAINFSGQSDSFGYNATAGQGTYIKGTGGTYIYGGGVFYDGSAIRTLLHSNNYSGYSAFSGSVSSGGNITATSYIYTSTYFQTGGNLIYPSGYGATQTLQVSNSANNAWIAGISIAPGGLVTMFGDARAPIFYDSNNTAYYIDAASTSSLNTLTMAGTITGALDATASFVGGVCTAASYNYVLGGANDTGNKLVIFVNGSTRTADGGVNALTIRNDGGAFILGQASYLTSILGSSVTINSNVALHAGNYNSYAPTLTGTGASGSWGISVTGNAATATILQTARTIGGVSFNGSANIDLPGVNTAGNQNTSGNAATATNLSTNRTNWSTNGTITAVVGQLAWKHYGNGHTIIDASNSTSPAGGAIGNTNPDVAWTGTYPTLMGWNGANTYGVRVDSSRYADQVSYSPNRTDSTTYPVLWGAGTSYTLAYSCASVYIQSSTGSLYANAFYDAGNTAFYIDPASESNLRALNIDGGTINDTNDATLYITAQNDNDWGIYVNKNLGGSTNFGVQINVASADNYGLSVLGGGSERFRVRGNGTVSTTADFRAPIFYDSNNTAFYTDPASTSVLNRLTIDGGNYAFDYFQSLSDFTSGTLVTTDIPATAAEGESFVMNVVGKSYSASTSPFNFSVQGYLYSSTIINYSGLSLDSTALSTVKIFENGGVLCFWWPTITYWNAFEVSVRAYNSAKNNYNRVTNITNSVEPTGTKKVTVTLQRFMRADVSATNSVDLRAPIFYDSNDTTYYTDPSSLSNILELKTNKTWYDSSASVWGGGINMGGNNPSIGFQSTASTWWYMLHHSSSNINFYRRSTSGSWNHDGIWDSSGNLIWQGSSVRAPIFYDQNNTAYYCDPNSTSNFVGLTVANTITGAISGNAGTATTLATARTLTIGSTGKTFNGSADVSWSTTEIVGYTPAYGNAAYQTKSLDTISTPGLYQYDGGFGGTKPPDNSPNYRTIEIGSSARFSQIAMPWNSDGYYFRRYDGTSFSTWRTVLHDGNYNSYAPTLTGTGASGSWGISVTGSSASCTGNSATTTLATKATRANGNFYIDDNYGNTVVGLYSPNRYQGVFTMGDAYKLTTDGTGVGNLYGIAWSHPNAGGAAGNLSDHGALILLNGTYAAAISSSIRCTADMRTPIYYDSNDTAYYLNPNGGSSLVDVTANEFYARNWFRNNDSGEGIYNQTTTQHFYTDDVSYWNVASSSGAQGIRFRTGGHGGTIRGYVYANDSNDVGLLNNAGNWRARVVSGDYFLADGSSIRGQIFYDSNDTNYYCDPNGTSSLAAVNANAYYPHGGVTESDIYARSLSINAYHHGDSLTYDTFQFNAASVYETRATVGSSFVSSTVETSIFRGDRFGGMTIANNTYQVRWTWNNTIGYKFFKTLYIANSTNGNSFTVTIESSANGSTWTTIATTGAMSNWPGHSWYNYFWNNNATQGYIRITVTPTWVNANTMDIYSMRYFCSYSLDAGARLYDWDYNRNVTFPAFVDATQFRDTNNTAYYIDAASTSNLVGLTVANTITGSVSGNAVTAGGLAVHSGRNNEANKIVRTDSNGYIQAGWINTTSGNEGTTAIDRVYASYDGFIRYYTPANFRTVLDVPTRAGSGASGSWGISVTGSSASCTGNAATVTNGVYTNTGNTLTGTNLFQSNLGTTSGSLSSPPLQAYATGTNAAFMSFHRGGSYAVNMGLDSDNVLRIGGWSASANRLQLDMNGNLTVAGAMYGTNFIDSDNTAYFCNPASTSNLNGLTTASDITVNGITIGKGAGNNLTNSAFGINALSANTGNGNSAFGYHALRYNTTGFSNTSVGRMSLRSNTSGVKNTAVGRVSLFNNTTGIGNSAFGYDCAFSSTYGSYNSAFGTGALRSNTYGNNISCFGYEALKTATAADNSSAFGFKALRASTSFENSAFGSLSMTAVVGGSGNSAFGHKSLFTGTSFSSSSAFGSYALGYTTTGTQNSAFGTDSLRANTSGSYNCAFGRNSGRDATTGSYNSFFGYNTGRGITTGSNNTVIGSRVGSLSANLSNNIIIADGSGNKRISVDSSGNTVFSGIVDATQFRDSSNTAFLLDPASTSILNAVRTRNTYGERVSVTSAASTTIDTQYNLTELTMSASITTLTLSNIQSSGTVHMWTIVTVGNGTAYSITWPAAVKWPSGAGPNVTGTNTKRDIYQFVTYDGGTTIYAIIVAQNL